MDYNPLPSQTDHPAVELITKKELARRLRVSERKIELDTSLPRVRWGRTVRFDWQDVIEFLKSEADWSQTKKLWPAKNCALELGDSSSFTLYKKTK